MANKVKKVIREQHIQVSIDRSNDGSGRFYFVSIKRNNETLNRNAVWVKDFDRAVEYAAKFLEDEKAMMEEKP